MSISRDRQAVGVAKEIWFANEKMYVRLADGREIGVPVTWFPKLKEATPEQRRNWRLIGGGIGPRGFRSNIIRGAVSQGRRGWAQLLRLGFPANDSLQRM